MSILYTKQFWQKFLRFDNVKAPSVDISLSSMHLETGKIKIEGVIAIYFRIIYSQFISKYVEIDFHNCAACSP